MKRTNIFNLLFEVDEESINRNSPENPVSVEDEGIKARPADDSVDDQIDALILRYENIAIKDDDENTFAESLNRLNLKILLEQEEDEDIVSAFEDDVEDTTPAEPGGSEDMDVKKPAKKQEIPPLDVDAFTSRMVRLIMNYENLLNIKEAIINRAKNFLDENYGDQYVNKYMETLEQEHGISFKEFKDVNYPDEEDFAIGANPAGAGITGGG